MLVIQEMVTSTEFRHVLTGTLAVLAQRLGSVFASATTWRRLSRERGWRRSRLRVHPAKPKLGIRAEKPNEIWHIDTTLIRLLDGSKAYVHAVIDNFSRRILSWRVAASFDPASTVAVLLEACRSSPCTDPPTVLTDGGVENVNRNIDEFIDSGLLRRVLAMTELRFDVEAAGLEVEEHLLPGLLALAHAVLHGDELLLALGGGAHDHEDALATFFEPDVEVDPVRPEVDVALARQAALLPGDEVVLPGFLE